MLSSLISPRSIAIIGASKEDRRPGGAPLHALTQYGYAGKVYAINPRYDEIRGLPCLPDVGALPEPVDLAIIAIPGAEVPRTIEACGKAGVKSAIILSAGFKEIGAPGAALQAELEAAIARSGMRVMGPNCIGMLNLGERVFAGFGAGFRQPDWRRGPVAMVSQSGGFAYSIVAFCQQAGVGIDYMVSTGNEADLGVLDFVEHFLEDPEIRLIALYIEGMSDGRRLRALGQRALERGKPIAVWKVGNTAVGQRAAVSHTANLTEEYDLFRDAFREGGFVEIREVYDLIDAAKAFRTRALPRGRRVAVVTTSGGAGVLLADRCEELRLELPSLTAASEEALKAIVPSFASLANPIDLTAALAQTEPQFAQATRIVVEDPDVDVAIVRSYPGRDVEVWADHFVEYARGSETPMLVSLSGTPQQAASWSTRLDEAGVPCFEVPSRAANAAAMLCDFAERTRHPRAVPKRPVERQSLSLDAQSSGLDEHVAKRCLAAYGIRTPRSHFLPLSAALPDALDLRFPVVAKIVSPDIVHKTEAGGVKLRVSRAALPDALRELEANARAYAPHATLSGFLLEEMAEGVEMIVGAIVSPSFGPLVVVGMGGVQAEVLKDVARRYGPISTDEAREMIASLRGAALLGAFRGRSARDIDALAECVSRLSWMIADHEDAVTEIEMNPVFVGEAGQGVLAADAVIRLRRN